MSGLTVPVTTSSEVVERATAKLLVEGRKILRAAVGVALFFSSDEVMPP